MNLSVLRTYQFALKLTRGSYDLALSVRVQNGAFCPQQLLALLSVHTLVTSGTSSCLRWVPETFEIHVSLQRVHSF